MSDLKPGKAPERVRQGSTGRPVLYVLIGGLALALIVFAGLGFYGNSLPDENIPGPQESGGVETSSPAPAESSATVVTPEGTAPAESATPGTPAAPAN